MFKSLKRGISAPIAITTTSACLVLAGGIIVWQYLQITHKKVQMQEAIIESRVPQTQEQVPLQEIAPEDATADWRTYRNEEFRFEVKYPKAWLSKEFISNPNQIFGVVFYEKEEMEKSVDIQIFTYKGTIEDFISKAPESIVESLSIDGYPAVLKAAEDPLGGSLRIFKNGYMFSVECHHSATDIWEKMWPTFRFLE